MLLNKRLDEIIDIKNETTELSEIIAHLFTKFAIINGDISELKLKKYVELFGFISKNPYKLFKLFITLNDSIKVISIKICRGNCSESFLKSLMTLLIKYLLIENPINVYEMMYIKQVALIWNIDLKSLNCIIEETICSDDADPCNLLNTNNFRSILHLKSTCYKLIKLYHPDYNHNIAIEILPYIKSYMIKLNGTYKMLRNKFLK